MKIKWNEIYKKIYTKMKEIVEKTWLCKQYIIYQCLVILEYENCNTYYLS